MRIPLAVAALGAVLAATLMPSQASAWCISLTAEQTCMPCITPEVTYQQVDEAVGGALPDREFPCVD